MSQLWRTFDILQAVKEGIIDLDITQQLSNFVKTTTGVNNSPTLTKRELKTKVGMQAGDVIVLGGLTESKDTNTRDGLSFLPSFCTLPGTSNPVVKFCWCFKYSECLLSEQVDQ